MAGRPSSFTDAIADAICDRLADGESLRAICKGEGMPNKATVMRWLGRDGHQAFRDHYAHAREAQADALFDEMLDIVDDTEEDVQRSRLKFDARKWMASKLQPKKYGDRQTVEIGRTHEDWLDELDRLKAEMQTSTPLVLKPLSSAGGRPAGGRRAAG